MNTRMTARIGTPIRLLLLIASLAVVTALLLPLFPEWLLSSLGLRVFWVSAALLFVLCGVLSWTLNRLDHTKVALRLALVLWAFLLISEEIFARSGTNELEEHFSSAVYGEISLWVLAFSILLILLIRNPGLLHHMPSGQSKWLFGFAALCILSAIYSSHPLFSAAWGFKLLLVILVLRTCSRLIQDEHDLISFVRATFWACCFLMVYEALADPSSWVTNGGRLGQSPTSLAVVAGIALVLSFSLRSLSNPIWPAIFSFTAALIMILSGGKAGIIGGVLSAVFFFLLRKRVGSAIALLIGLVGLGVLLLMSTPLRFYAEAYTEKDQADNLTGRTDLWVGALPLIRQSPIIGHGYMASKYISNQIEDVRWEAGHLHNAFLDVLYNNGVIGLLLILYMHGMIVKNLLRAIGQKGVSRVSYEIATAFLAIYLNLLVNAFFNAIIGGRPNSLFMIFLAIFVGSENLRQTLTQTTDYAVKTRITRYLSAPAVGVSDL